MRNLLHTHPQYAMRLVPFASVLARGTGLFGLDHSLRNAPGPKRDRRVIVLGGATGRVARDFHYSAPRRCGQVQRAAVVADGEAATLEDSGCLPQGGASGEVYDAATQFRFQPLT